MPHDGLWTVLRHTTCSADRQVGAGGHPRATARTTTRDPVHQRDDPVALGQSGNTYHCAVTNNGNGLVTSNATLTVVSVQTANVNAYRSAVTSEAGLLAYFPGDGSTGTTLANTVLEPSLKAEYVC